MHAHDHERASTSRDEFELEFEVLKSAVMCGIRIENELQCKCIDMNQNETQFSS